jgi:23S rRNA pseudouridine1911/1915/1917 synthase
MIIAKDPKTAQDLKKQFKNRKIRKTYLAFAHGMVRPVEDIIYLPVGRKTGDRTKMSTTMGKPAITKYKVIDYFVLNKNEFTYLKLIPKTGRMHQIRVHLKHKGNPIVGDQKYLKGKYKKITNQLGINRQLLHAYKIKFKHPRTQKIMEFKAPIPNDFKDFKNQLTIF